MSGGQRVHDVVPNASLPPANEAIVARRARSVAFASMRNDAPDCKTRKNAVENAPVI
jgi:hypothetical protein